ncbi:MAG TPA: hypothetical protein VFR24_17615 [Candidatus Angelobacter sp.]|nr:hypothetical protein [Candidatus Angelobacter sp.]
MRRSKLFSIAWSSRPKQLTQQSSGPQPNAAVLRIFHISLFRCAAMNGAILLALFLVSSSAFAQAPSSSSQLTADLSHSPGWVVITVDEYQNLRSHAYPAEHGPEPPPVDATLTRVDYDLRIAGELATGRASLTVDVLKDGWVRVPIPPGLLVREARLDGKLVSLVPEMPGKGGSEPTAVLAHAGRAVLQLDIALPVNVSAGEERIALPSTSSGVTRAQVQLPRQGVDVKLTGGLLAENTETGTESRWLAYARGNEPLTFTWRRKMEDHHVTLPLRQRGSLAQLTSLGEDATSIYAEVNLQVTQGAAKEARIQLPENITVNQVSGAMVADWEVKAGELVVTFLEPVEQSARFVITGESKTPRDGHIEIALMRLLNIERDTGGGVAVEVLGAGEIKDLKSQGLENADATDLGDYFASRQSPSMVVFRLRSGDSKVARSLAVDVARYAQQAVLMANVEEARYHVLLSKEGKTLVEAQYAIRNNQRNFLKVTLPANAAVWSASLAGNPVRPGQSPDGSLLLPLEKARAGEEAPLFTVEVFYLVRDSAWVEKGKATLALPALDLPVSRTGVLLYHPPLFKLTAEPGAFRVETYEAPASDVFRITAGPESTPIDVESMGMANKADRFSQNTNGNLPQSATQTLVDNYKTKSLGGRSAKVLPIRPEFPAFGPSLFFVSELTEENHAPLLELSYQREKKEGSK